MTPSQPFRGLKRLVISATDLISAMALKDPLASPAKVELDTTTISVAVAVAQGNPHCLIETKTITVDEAFSIAKAFTPVTASATRPAMR